MVIAQQLIRDHTYYRGIHTGLDFSTDSSIHLFVVANWLIDFRNLREMFHIDAADYMMSICGDDSLKELSSPGKSGSIFYLSQDERFVIKTLRKAELKVSPRRLSMRVCCVLLVLFFKAMFYLFLVCGWVVDIFTARKNLLHIRFMVLILVNLTFIWKKIIG